MLTHPLHIRPLVSVSLPWPRHAGLANVRPGTLFCRIAGVINVHSYSPAGIVIELCLDLPNEHEERTMIVNSSGQIMVKTVHDHERVPEIGLA